MYLDFMCRMCFYHVFGLVKFHDVFYLFAGPLSSIWKEWIKWCIEFGIEANAIMAVPYDWRLSPSILEERDIYFHKLKYVSTSLHLAHLVCCHCLLLYG